jgi:acetyltransferase-like isoleucine patch superfamily enzyme
MLLDSILLLINTFLFRSKFSGWRNRFCLSTRIYDSRIGNYNYFGPNVIINNAKIGNYCSIAPNVVIGGMEHDYKVLSTSTRIFPDQQKNLTVIQDDVWIATNSVIKSGITIGRGSVIGAHSLVLKDVPPYTIMSGSPARFLKQRFTDSKVQEIHSTIDFTADPFTIKQKINSLC